MSIMQSLFASLVHPERPPRDRVRVVVLCGVYMPGFAAHALFRILKSDAGSRTVGVVDIGAAFVILAVLVRELYLQGHRPGAQWTTSDTANTAVVGGLAILIGTAVIFMTPPEHERITGTVVAVLYMALALTFAATRRRALIASNKRSS
jgi:hypothetical protein